METLEHWRLSDFPEVDNGWSIKDQVTCQGHVSIITGKLEAKRLWSNANRILKIISNPVLHLAKFPLKSKQRIKVFERVQEFKTFTSYVCFLRKLVRNFPSLLRCEPVMRKMWYAQNREFGIREISTQERMIVKGVPSRITV